MALAARTPAVSTQACSRWITSMYWGWWLPGTPPIPAVGDVRAGDGVPPAGLLLVVRQVAHLAAGRLHPARDPAQPARPVPGAAHQVRDLRDVLVLLRAAVLGDAGLPRACGQLPDRLLVGGGDHPPAGEEHLPARGGQGQQVLDELVARAGPVDADHDPAPEPGGDLPDGRGQHLLMVGERVRPGVPGPEQHREALAGIPAPRPQWVEAVAFLPGGSRSLLIRVRGDQGGVHVDDHPPGQVFPAMASHGNPAGVSPISFHACARALARARAIRSSTAGAPARSSARRTVGPLGAPPAPGPVGEHRDVAHARGPQHDRGRHRDQHDPPVKDRRRALLPQRGAEPAGQSRLVSGQPRQDRARWPTRPAPSAVTFRAWSHPLCCMTKSAPVMG